MPSGFQPTDPMSRLQGDFGGDRFKVERTPLFLGHGVQAPVFASAASSHRALSLCPWSRSSGAPLDTTRALRANVLLPGLDYPLEVEMFELSSLELLSLSPLDESDESRAFLPAAFRACRFALFRAFLSFLFRFSRSALASSYKYYLPDLSILNVMSQTPQAHGGTSASQSFWVSNS